MVRMACSGYSGYSGWLTGLVGEIMEVRRCYCHDSDCDSVSTY